MPKIKNSETDEQLFQLINERRAAIYARFSSYKQNEKSIKDQIKDCQEYADELGLIVRNCDIFTDEAKTATTIRNRLGLEKLLDSAKEKRFSYVIVWKLDRLNRDLKDSLDIEQKLKDNGVQILSYCEKVPIDSLNDPSFRLLLNMNRAIDTYFSQELSQKTSRGMYNNFIEGKSTGGVIPFGYRKIEERTGENKDLPYEIDPEERGAIEKIFKDYLGGKTAQKIADELNADGYKTHKVFKSELRNSVFLKTSIYSILRNEKYAGIFTYNMEYKGKKPEARINKSLAIIDEDLFFKVQEKLGLNKKHKNTAHYILSGITYCANCGCKITGRSGSGRNKSYHYYTCTKSHGPCDFISIKQEELEDFVVKKVREELMNPKLHKRFKKEFEKLQKDNDIKKMKEKIVVDIKDKEKSRDLYLKKYAEMTASDDDMKKGLADEFLRMGSELKVEIIRLKNELARLEELENASKISDNDFEQNVKKVMSNCTKLPPEVLVSYFVRLVIIQSDEIISEDGKSSDVNYNIAVYLKNNRSSFISLDEEKTIFIDRRTKIEVTEKIQDDNDDDDSDHNDQQGPDSSSGSDSSNRPDITNTNQSMNINKMVKQIKGIPNVLRQFLSFGSRSVICGEPNWTNPKHDGVSDFFFFYPVNLCLGWWFTFKKTRHSSKAVDGFLVVK